MNNLAFWCFYGSCKLRHATVAMAIRGRGGGALTFGAMCVSWHAVGVCDRCSKVFVCVRPTRGAFTVLACGELSNTPTPHHPNQTTSDSSLQGFISGSVLPSAAPVVMVTALSVTQDDARRWERVSGSSDFWSLPWIITQRLRGPKPAGSSRNMDVVLFAVIYGGSRAGHATLLQLHFIS